MRRSMLAMMVALGAAAGALGGCDLGGSSGPPPTNAPGPLPPGFTQFTDIPIPPKNTIDLDRTLVFGSDRDWIGRISLATSLSVSDTYDFYKREMPKLGWAELTSVRSATSVLTYQLDNRVATITVVGQRFSGGSQVDFFMNPRTQGGGGASSFGSSGGLSAPPAASPRSGGIDSAPLPPARRP